MDSVGVVGDVTFSTGSVQTVRQIRKVVVNETDLSSTSVRRTAIEREREWEREKERERERERELEREREWQRERERERERERQLEREREWERERQRERELERQRERERELRLSAANSSNDLVVMRMKTSPPIVPPRTRNQSKHTETQTQFAADSQDLYANQLHVTTAGSSNASLARSGTPSTNLSGHCKTFGCCCEQHTHSQPQTLPLGAQCNCCPFGFHIAVDFVQFAESKPNGTARNGRSQLDSIKRRSEQLARTRDLFNEHDSLRARVALANALVPPSPSNEQLAPDGSRLAHEIGSALDVSLQQFANTNGHFSNSQTHGHAHRNALDCPVCARRVPIVPEREHLALPPEDAVSNSNLSASAASRRSQTADEVFDQTSNRFSDAQRLDMSPRVDDVETASDQYLVTHHEERVEHWTHVCDHKECEARQSDLESQLLQMQEALRLAEQQRLVATTKLEIITKQYSELMVNNRIRIDRAVATDDRHGLVTRDTQTDAPVPISPLSPPPSSVRPTAPRRTVGVGDCDINDLSAFVVTCERCEERRKLLRLHADTQTENSVRNVATYYRPPTRDVGIGYVLDDVPLRPATRDCQLQTDSDDKESESETVIEVSSESVSEFIRTFQSSVETTTLSSTGMLRLLRAITSQMSTAEFHALFRAAFKRDVRTVELQATPRCYSIATGVDRSDFQKEAACGEDYHRLEIPRLSSSIAVQCQPSYHHKYIWTETAITFDVGSATSDIDVRSRGTQAYAPLTVHSSAQTDRVVSTVNYNCDMAIGACPNHAKGSVDRAGLDESYTFEEHEHVTVVVNGVVETRCVREVRSLGASTHSHDDQLFAASYHTRLSSATETPAENEREEAFVSRPAVPHRFVAAGSDFNLVSEYHDRSPPGAGAEHTDRSLTPPDVAHDSHMPSNDSRSFDDAAGYGSADSEEMLADCGSQGSLSAAPSGSPRQTQKSILKKSSKPETPVETPVSSPSRPKKSITFATETLVVGSSHSSLADDPDGVYGDESLHAVVYTDQIRETSLVDSVQLANDGPVLSVTRTCSSNTEREETVDEDAEDEDAFTRLRNTTLNSYSAYSDLSGINDANQDLRDCSSPSFDLPPEVRSACELVENWLEEPDREDLKVQYETSMQVIATEWFRVVSEPNRDAVELLEDYLRIFNDDFSSDLVERVVRLTDAAGNTAMHYALWKQQFDVVDLLLSTEACDCDAVNAAGYSPVMLAAECKPRSDEHRDVLRRIFENGDVNKRSQTSTDPQDNSDGPTALFIAAAHGEPEVVRLLLECGANPNACDKSGSTALHCAAEHGHADSVQALLAAGANVNAADVDDSTPLHCAAERGDVQVAQALVADSGCDVQARNRSGQTACDVAQLCDHWSIASLLAERT